MAKPPPRAQNETVAEARLREAVPLPWKVRSTCHGPLDGPEAVFDDGDLLALGGEAGGLEIGAADHHVEVHGRLVQPPRRLLGTRSAEAGAERDVRRRVLVQQRVEVRASA